MALIEDALYMKYKAVFFDLGGTLIKTVEVPEIFRRILGTYGVVVTKDRILEAHIANEEELDLEKGLVELGYSFWRQWNVRLLNRLGIGNNVEFLAEKIDELWWKSADLQFYPDAMETLTQLKSKQVKLGVVTNCVKKDYDQILQRLVAESYFDVVVGIDSCNKSKPDSEIFLYAADRLQLRPSEILFVGDSVERDYEGATRVGFKSLLIDRKGNASKSVDSIRSLTEVLQFF